MCMGLHLQFLQEALIDPNRGSQTQSEMLVLLCVEPRATGVRSMWRVGHGGSEENPVIHSTCKLGIPLEGHG